MEATNKGLFVFSIGPVQSFIASSRKAEDLWSGSYLLSYLTETAIQTTLNAGLEIEMIFPNVTQESLKNIELNRSETASFPNRFMFKVQSDHQESISYESIEYLAQTIKNAVEEALVRISEYSTEVVFYQHQLMNIRNMAKQQIKEMLEFFWSFKYLDDEYEEVRKELEGQLSSEKNDRNYGYGLQKGLVCTVCSQRDSLTDQPFDRTDNYEDLKRKVMSTWTNKQDRSIGLMKKGERLCAVCLAKRLLRRYFKEHAGKSTSTFSAFPSTGEIAGNSSYYAMLLMDGDNMGKWLSGEEPYKLSNHDGISIDYHKEVSSRLSFYSGKTVPEIVNRNEGRLIYSGGDDVLALVPIKRVLQLAGELRDNFGSSDKGLSHNATASAGIIIAHKNTPLQMVLNTLRGLESKAKNYNQGNKNAFALGVHTSSGEIREVALPWSITHSEKYEYLKENCLISKLINVEKGLNHDLSTTFVTKMTQSLLPLVGGKSYLEKVKPEPFNERTTNESFANQMNERVIYSEILRLVKRSVEKSSSTEVMEITETIFELYDVSNTMLEFINTLGILRFFNKERKQGDVGYENKSQAN